jgi:hypothetical protein
MRWPGEVAEVEDPGPLANEDTSLSRLLLSEASDVDCGLDSWVVRDKEQLSMLRRWRMRKGSSNY